MKFRSLALMLCLVSMVAAGIARTDPAFLEYGDIRDAVYFRKVIRCGKSMSATADNDDVIAWFGGRITPRRRPPAVSR